MNFTVKSILNICSYDKCHKKQSECGSYCDTHNIINNINTIIYYKNPKFQFWGLLDYKLTQILSQIQEELDEEMLDVQVHRNTVYMFNIILYKCTGLKLNRDLLEHRDFYSVLDEYLVNLCCEAQQEGPIGSEMDKLVNDMELVNYIKSF